MIRFVKTILILAAFAFMAPAVVSAGPLDLKTTKKIKKIDTTSKASKLKNNRKVRAIGKTEEGKLVKKRLGNSKIIKKIKANKLKKMNTIKKVRINQKAKLVKMGKKLDKATLIKTKGKKQPGKK